MKRRDFLKGLAAVPAVSIVGFPEAAPLMIRTEKHGFVPLDTKHSTGNRILTIDEITREALRILNSKLKWSESEQAIIASRNAPKLKTNTIKIRRPVRFTV